MNFTEAMSVAALDGKRVTRTKWSTEEDCCTFVFFQDNRYFQGLSHSSQSDHRPYLVNMTLEDVLATDWEIW